MAEQTYVSVRVPTDIYRAVSASAEKEERSVSAQVRRILKRYLAEEGKPLKAA